MINRNNFKTGDLCYVINRDVCDGTVKSISDYIAIILEKVDRYRYRFLHKKIKSILLYSL